MHTQRDSDCEPTQPTDYNSSPSPSPSSQSNPYSYSANTPPFAFATPTPAYTPPSFNHPFFQRNPTEEEELKLKKRHK